MAVYACICLFFLAGNVKSSSRKNSNGYHDGYLNGFPWVFLSGPAAGFLFSLLYFGVSI